jgi:hypothetical protein
LHCGIEREQVRSQSINQGSEKAISIAILEGALRHEMAFQEEVSTAKDEKLCNRSRTGGEVSRQAPDKRTARAMRNHST